jgi:multidrug efflux pump subunit AcrA (membrane-fusion protein)
MVAQKVYALNQANLAMGDAQIAVDDAMTAVTAAQQAVDDASYAVTKQQQAADNAKLDLADTQKALQDASKKLADAQGKSPEIKAPFDGFVTDINVSGGDQVPNGTVAATVADPNKFEADIMVSEMDIMKVSLGEGATVSLNAITGLQLPAKVTRIAPTASIASGVVNYVVKVELDEQAVSRIQAAGASANITAGATANATGPGGAALQRAIDSGRVPQAQAGAAQQAPPSGNFPSGGFSGGRASSQVPSSGITQNFQLKQGLTGTVDLIVAQKSNVLLVPSSAISKSGNQSTVQVMTSNNTIEKRTIQTGLADWQNTEVTGGLNEGDKIVITKATSTATSTSSSQQGPPQGPPGGIFIGR